MAKFFKKQNDSCLTALTIRIGLPRDTEEAVDYNLERKIEASNDLRALMCSSAYLNPVSNFIIKTCKLCLVLDFQRTCTGTMHGGLCRVDLIPCGGGKCSEGKQTRR
ncbi:hypothetical protein D5086_023862 [Populus alba]|uniref:Uncharacterized protein n=1 Tax=Populus alba TaxID=43335 RepID=A0ACC4BBL5_POPAL